MGLLHNAALLLAVCFIYDLMAAKWRRGKPSSEQVFTGFILGLFGIIVMSTPWEFAPGVFFDTRSVLLSISGLFFGSLPTVVALSITVAFRILQGGSGAWMGVAVLIASGAIGIAWRHIRRDRLAELSWKELYLLGLIVHAVMLLWMLLLPRPIALNVFSKIGPPVMLIFPLGVVLVGKLMSNRLRRELSINALTESEELFRGLFENNHAVMLIIDPNDGAIIDANPAAAAFYGSARDHLKRMKIDDINILSPSEIKVEMDRARIEERRHFHFRHRLADGSIRNVDVYSGPISFEGRQMLYSIIHDVTERKQAEDALRESEEKFRRLFETMAQGVVYQSADGAIISANPAAERILGLSLDQMLGKTSMDPGWRAIREDGSEVSGRDHPAMTALRTGRPVDRFVMGIFNPQKNAHSWLSVTAIPLFQPGETTPFQAYATFDDITEQRKAREDYQTLFREMLDGFALHEIVCDSRGMPADYRFLDVNPAFERMTGLNATDIIGKTVLEALPGTEQSWIETYGQVALTGRPIFFENYSGQMDKHFEITAFRPAPNQFACIFADVTRRNLIEKEKEQLQVQLHHARKMEAIGTLAGGVAHDFNNLLQAIIGYTQILLLPKTESDPEFASLKAIQKAGDRAAGLVRQLLLFSRNTESDRKPVELNHEVEQARLMLERIIPKMIEIEVHMGSRLWTITADHIQIEQILLNLGTNAADAMPDGGKLIVRTENIALDEEYLINHAEVEPGRYVLLTVSDTGQGMDRETMGHIFEPFFTTKEVGKGTGLGLASVYGIVKNHGGYIACYSEIGQGTTFKIYLPAIEPADTDEPKDVGVKQHKGGTETILVVDDENSIRDFASQVLIRFGYTVLTAAGGEEALEIYLGNPRDIDLVVMDLGMPGMGGRKCLEELVRIDPAVKVLIASGYSIDGQVKKAIEAGAEGFVAKPYQLTDLLDKVRVVLDGY
jgi:PAS domain S-box-containing protein